MMQPCLSCGELSDARRCEDCAPSTTALRATSSRERGYDAAWDRVSVEARRLQPWCLDCGREDRLTADHLPSAWARKAAGLAIRVEDVEVLCSDCNAARGSSRPGSQRAEGWGVDRPAGPSGPYRKAESGSVSTGGCRTSAATSAARVPEGAAKCRTPLTWAFTEVPQSAGRFAAESGKPPHPPR